MKPRKQAPIIRNGNYLIQQILSEETSKDDFMLRVMGKFVADKKEKDYLIDALREVGAEPMFYQLNNAYLIITLTEIDPPLILVSENPRKNVRAWELFRKWGEIDGGSNQARQVFDDYTQARQTYDIIIRDKKRKGYRPIF